MGGKVTRTSSGRVFSRCGERKGGIVSIQPGNFAKCVAGLILVITLGGCISKSTARKQRNVAFIEGKNAGMMQALQTQAQSVTVIGDVKNRVLTWNQDMTVATAFLQANYQGVVEPRGFLVRHGSEQFRLSADELLDGKDLQLLPGDTLEIQQ